jgi:hypothetical protein
VRQPIAMRRLLLALALSIALVPHVRAGGGGGLIFAESLDKAITEAKLRNVPIIAFYLDDNDKDCPRLRGGGVASAKFVDWCNENAIAVVGQAETHPAQKELDPKTKKEVEVCPKYPQISCKVHERVFADASGRFVWTSFPAVYICNPDGALAIDQTELRDWGGELFQKKLVEIQKKLPGAPATRSQLAFAEATFAKGDERLEKGKPLEAVKHYEKVSKESKFPEQVRKLGEARIAALDEKGNALVEEAKADKDKHQAVVKLKKLAADWKGRAASDAANKAADELAKAPAPKKE